MLSRLRWARSSLESSAWWSPSSAERLGVGPQHALAHVLGAGLGGHGRFGFVRRLGAAGRGSPTVVLAIRSIASRSSRRPCQRASSS